MIWRLWIGRVVGAGLAATAMATIAPAAEEAGASARSPEAQRIISAAREGSRAMEHLDALCNRIGPRLSGSDNLTTACEWARRRFVEFGIDNARLEPWGEFPVGFNRGPWFGRVVEPEPRSLEFVTRAWSAGTRGVVRGKAVLAPKDRKELDEARAKGTLAGAWVLLPPKVEPAAKKDAAKKDAAKKDAAKKDAAKKDAAKADPRVAEAAKAEAEFLRTLRDELEAAKAAGIVEPSARELLLTTGSYRISWDKLPTFPGVTLLRKQFDEIAGWLAAGKAVTLEFDIRNHFKKGPIALHNVIADIPGTERPDEYVIVGGHIDSWDGATGATDNGTGVATTLEAARILMKAGVRPRRTIRFMLWSGEEQGLLGSEAYVKAHKDLMPRISAVFVHDGGTNYLSGIGVPGPMMADIERVFAPVKELDPAYPFGVYRVGGLSGGGSDHSSFLGAGVPGFYWNQAGKAQYVHTHHTQFDTYDAAIPDYQAHSSLVVALAAYGVAELDHLLSREDLRGPRPQPARRRVLGVQLDAMTVAEVADGSIARKAGIRKGDVIARVDGARVSNRMWLRRAILAGGPKEVVTVLRDGKEVEVKLEWEPAAASR